MGACTTGYTDIARVLLKHGANVDHCDEVRDILNMCTHFQ